LHKNNKLRYEKIHDDILVVVVYDAVCIHS